MVEKRIVQISLNSRAVKVKYLPRNKLTIQESNVFANKLTFMRFHHAYFPDYNKKWQTLL